MMENISHFKQKLEEELIEVEDRLRAAGMQNDAGEWEAVEKDIDETATESDELADRMEEYGEDRAEVGAIQIHWRNIERALEKIEAGTYGACEVCGEAIEENRLEVNASARTCKTHLDEEAGLPA
ncbi:TraR/DksA C4-type zinc finger protein [Patescibacteria group bacterium]|nr:TraR/DksA C4-type zinc finger protein [Patescibacteria group bacterium]